MMPPTLFICICVVRHHYGTHTHTSGTAQPGASRALLSCAASFSHSPVNKYGERCDGDL